MQSYPQTIDGQDCTIHFVVSSVDRWRFLEWVRQHAHRPVAVDTETTGLNYWTDDFRMRLVQFGTARTVWVLPVDRAEPWTQDHRQAVRDAFGILRHLVIHHARADVLFLARDMGMDPRRLWEVTTDTRILAHLIDPRGRDEGGIGHSLKALAASYVDPNAPDLAAELHAAFRAAGYTMSTGWARIDLRHPTYVRYSGGDVLLTARLYDRLAELVRARGQQRLADFEHTVARICAEMENRGFLVDVDYTCGLVDRLRAEEEAQTARARLFGVDSVHAPAQVAAALERMGETLTERTRTGAAKVDQAVLLALADRDHRWQRRGARDPNPLAEAVLRAKRAAKWRTSYADAILELHDAEDRVHPGIASLQARTARMAVSRPPVQQLPAGDHVIRRCFLAEPGHVIGSADYQAVELRVLAALSGDRRMIEAIHAGRDLHGYTASLIWGPEWTPYHRKLAKSVGFGKVYGGGAATLARQTGAPLADVERAVRAYDRVYPGVRRFSRRVVERARLGRPEVETVTGRILPVDRHRLYAATNYAVQSVARDVLAQALIDLDRKGLGEYLRLPIHDEIVFSVPRDEAHEIGREIADTMAVPDFFGVPLAAEVEIGGRSWGSLYEASDNAAAPAA
ncbi:hypothetical protein GCM10012275_19130 [Longimycelium tulufanense]|uniref:DNA polymerase I n=1 Tax=Longimycelium tulufanense TaxID=907463 RepID=A0A8J3FU73_9PSEU|nr:DNA polymerase [Longimycelium tulufanense]GGM48276.1 hypothetical protein GCM10012275_19130 [Longimycelium tulufanense]